MKRAGSACSGISPGRKRRHREAPAAMPGAGEALPFHLEAPFAPGAQHGDVAVRVVADEHRVVPARQARRAEVLQHAAPAGRPPAPRTISSAVRREDVGQPAVPARGADELERKAAAPLREVDLGRECLRARRRRRSRPAASRARRDRTGSLPAGRTASRRARSRAARRREARRRAAARSRSRPARPQVSR